MGKPRSTKKTLHKATLDEWQEEFWYVYKDLDKKRDLHKVWSMAYEDATKVGEAIREGNPKECLKALAHTFCWIASFVAKLGKDESCHPRFKGMKEFNKLSSVVWFKYREVCPACGESPCVCPIKRAKYTSREWAAERKRIWAKIKNEEPGFKKAADVPNKPLDWWQAMFRDIYLGTHNIIRLEDIGFHLLEEMGEVEERIRDIATRRNVRQKLLKKLQEDLVGEVADTVSWCFSIVRKIAADAETFKPLAREYGLYTGFSSSQAQGRIASELTLARVLLSEYCPEGQDTIRCPTCWKRSKGRKGRPCGCKIISDWRLMDPRFKPSR